MPQGFFRAAFAVHVSGIDEIDTRIESRLDDLIDFRLWRILRTETIGAKTDDRNANAGTAELTVNHGRPTLGLLLSMRRAFDAAFAAIPAFGKLSFHLFTAAVA